MRQPKEEPASKGVKGPLNAKEMRRGFARIPPESPGEAPRQHRPHLFSDPTLGLAIAFQQPHGDSATLGSENPPGVPGLCRWLMRWGLIRRRPPQPAASPQMDAEGQTVRVLEGSHVISVARSCKPH